MKNYILLATGLFISLQAFAQLTEGEKLMRDITTDTLLGWNTGGVAALNLTQTSFPAGSPVP